MKKDLFGLVRSAVLAGLLSFLVAVGSGCARVKPWEREHLARPTMTFEGDVSFEQLLFEAREGSAGGYGNAGGGCGCKR